MDRRRMLRVAARFGATVGVMQIVGCSRDASAATASDPTSSGKFVSAIPSETASPYPGDSSNGPNVLDQSGVVRSDIRASFAGLSGSTAGVPLQILLSIVSASTCTALADYAVYLWHCDAVGNCSLYSAGVTHQNWLRGVQAADANGVVRFTSIYPGCYSGRWPHIHSEVYQPGRGDVGLQQDRDVADRPAAHREKLGLCDVRLRVERAQPISDHAGQRHGLQRRRVARAGDRHRRRDERDDRGAHGGGVSGRPVRSVDENVLHNRVDFARERGVRDRGAARRLSRVQAANP